MSAENDNKDIKTSAEEEKDSAQEMPVKQLEELHKPPRSNHGSRLMLWVLIGVAVVICAGLLTIAPYMMEGSDKDVTVRIPKDATMQNLTDTLNKYFPEAYTDKVVKLLALSDFDPKERHGAYDLPKGATPFATMRKISRGSQSPVRLTINGFRTMPVLAERMGRKMEFSKEDFLKAVQDSAYLAQYGLTPEQAMSLFFEDTYEVYWSASPYDVLDKIGRNYKNFWTEGKTRAAAEGFDLTPAEMMTLASIVDEETNQVLEKGRIGRLYVNRLDKDMKLQADPTVRFAIGDFSIQRVTNNHLKFESPYNTYLHEGLPPGPLRTTSRKTVEEILNSKPSEDLFMCARPDFSGFHNFASTYEQHLENARAYQKALDERGIK